jgi:hypothetical protein
MGVDQGWPCPVDGRRLPGMAAFMMNCKRTLWLGEEGRRCLQCLGAKAAAAAGCGRSGNC